MSTLVDKVDATAVEVSFTDDALCVMLADGRSVNIPLAWFPRLLAASAKQRAKWEFIGGGIGIHWPAIDEDISIASLLQPESFMRLPEKQQRASNPAKRKQAPQSRRGA